MQGRIRRDTCRFGFGGSEAVEEGPVGFVGVEDRSDSVVREAAESEDGAFDALVMVLCCRRARWRPARGAS